MPDTPTDVGDPPDPTNRPPASALDSDRYGHLSLENGSVVIYDRESPETWLQSDVSVDVG